MMIGLLLPLCIGCSAADLNGHSRPVKTSVAAPTLVSPEQTAAPASAEVIQVPQYSGEIGQVAGDKSFVDFLFAHDGEVVNLNVYISGTSNDHYGEDWLTLCEGATAEDDCTLISINYVATTNSRSLFLAEEAGKRTLKGNWQVRVNPGMYQGFLSISLIAAP